MITVLEDKEGIRRIFGNPTLDSLDGERRAPLLVIMHTSWTEQERAEFGVFAVPEFAPPEGMIAVGEVQFVRTERGIEAVCKVAKKPIIEPVPVEKRIEAFFQDTGGFSLEELRAALNPVTRS